MNVSSTDDDKSLIDADSDEDNSPIDEVMDCDSSVNSWSVAKVASNEELNNSKSVILPWCEPLVISNLPNLPSANANVPSTDDDKSLIDADNDEDKLVIVVLVSSNDVDTDDDNSLIDVEIDEDKSVINSLFSLKDEDTDCDSSVIEDEIEEDKSLINSLFSLKDEDTDCDNSLIDQDSDDESVVNSLSTTKFSSLPN